MKRTFLAALGLGGALLAAMPAAAAGDPVVVRVGDETLRIPAAWLEDGPQAFWEQALAALGLSASAVRVRIPEAELAATAPGGPASGESGTAAGARPSWSLLSLSPRRERAERQERERAARIWFRRDEFAAAEVRRHASGLYMVRPRDASESELDYRVAVRMPPEPERPLPPDLVAAHCWHHIPQRLDCSVDIPRGTLRVGFTVAARDLHLLNPLRAAIGARVDAWRQAP